MKFKMKSDNSVELDLVLTEDGAIIMASLDNNSEPIIKLRNDGTLHRYTYNWPIRKQLGFKIDSKGGIRDSDSPGEDR